MKRVCHPRWAYLPVRGGIKLVKEVKEVKEDESKEELIQSKEDRYRLLDGGIRKNRDRWSILEYLIDLVYTFLGYIRDTILLTISPPLYFTLSLFFGLDYKGNDRLSHTGEHLYIRLKEKKGKTYLRVEDRISKLNLTLPISKYKELVKANERNRVEGGKYANYSYYITREGIRFEGVGGYYIPLTTKVIEDIEFSGILRGEIESLEITEDKVFITHLKGK